MIRHFSIPAILHMIPQPVLEQFFRKLGRVAPVVNWKYLQPGEIHPIIEFISQAGAEKQMMIENALYQISELACESGIVALREASGNALPMQSADDYLSLAMRVWIEQPEIFHRATLLQQVDHLERWHRRVDLPRIAPQSSNEVLSHLGKAMTDVLNDGQSRCGYCSVEHMRRADGTDCFLAYPEGVWQTTLIHDVHGNLVAHSIRSALEIVFVYNHSEGVLETFADVPVQLERQLENAFCKIVLGVDAALPQRPAYNLNVLKEGPARLATDPADGVAAHVCRMRLAILNSLRIIILVADRTRQPLMDEIPF